MLNQCSRKNHPVAESDDLQVVEDLCETPSSPDGDPVAALFKRKAVWTTLDPSLVVIQYIGDISTAVSGLNNFVSCDVVQDSSEIVIEETPKEETVEMETEGNVTNVTNPAVSADATDAERSPEIGDLPGNGGEAEAEDEPEVVDLSDDDDEDEAVNVAEAVENVKRVLHAKAHQVSGNVFSTDTGKDKPVVIKPLPKLPAGLQVIRSVDLLDEPPERRPPPPLIEINKKKPATAPRPSTCSREEILKKLPKSTNIVASPSLSKRFDSLVMKSPSPSPRKKSDTSPNSANPSRPSPNIPVRPSPSRPKTSQPKGQISLTPCAPPAEVAEFVDISEDEGRVGGGGGGGDEEVAVLPAPPPLLRIGRAVTLPENQHRARPPPPSQNLMQPVDPSSQFSTPQKRPSTSSEARDTI